MAKSSHPSAQSRVSTPQTAAVAVAQRLRGILPAASPSKLPSRTPAPFHAAQSTLSLGDPSQAKDLLAGRFNFAGQLLDVGPWTTAAPSRRFAGWLHEFDWLHDLVAGGGEAHLAKARVYVDAWLDTYGCGNEFVFEPARLARRLFNWLALWSPTLSAPGLEDSATGLGDKVRVLERRRTNIVRQLSICLLYTSPSPRDS